ncbi:MAG: hypothetical protein ABIQ15_05875 [Nocardioides sp.]
MASEQSPGTGGDRVEKFQPTSGRITGVVLVVGGIALAALALLQPSEVIPEVGAGGALAAVLGWAASLRPGVSVVEDDLQLRNMLETVTIPLVAVEELAVRQVLAVRAGRKRYTSPALGRGRRSLATRGTAADTPTDGQRHVSVTYPEYVEQQIRKRVADACAAAGVRPGSAEQLALAAGVRREPAWPEIVAIVVSVLALTAVIVR